MPQRQPFKVTFMYLKASTSMVASEQLGCGVIVGEGPFSLRKTPLGVVGVA